MEALGNRLTDEAAKQASLQEGIRLFSMISSMPKVTLTLPFAKEEEKKLDKTGTIKAGDGR